MSTLAVIPARGGSKGLPGKNLRPLLGRPLVEHSLLLARLCPEISRTVVSTDSEAIAAAARAAGGEVIQRPSELARDETPMWPVLRHALEEVDPRGDTYEALLLLDPTSPGRLPEDVARAHELLAADDDADAVVAVSEPGFNPLWHGVTIRGGYLEPLTPGASGYGRRQDVPSVYRINAVLYLFRASFVRSERDSWLDGRLLPLVVPELRAFHIDDETDFRLCELVLEHELVRLPWL